MVALFKSYITPLVILFAVPIGLVGVIVMLYFTGTAINVQSLLGRDLHGGHRGLEHGVADRFRREHSRARTSSIPTEAIRKAASIRVRPIVMTALAAFFALIPMALALGPRQRGQRPAGPGGHRRPAGRPAHDAVRRAGALLAGGPARSGRRPRRAQGDNLGGIPGTEAD